MEDSAGNHGYGIQADHMQSTYSREEPETSLSDIEIRNSSSQDTEIRNSSSQDIEIRNSSSQDIEIQHSSSQGFVDGQVYGNQQLAGVREDDQTFRHVRGIPYSTSGSKPQIGGSRTSSSACEPHSAQSGPSRSNTGAYGISTSTPWLHSSGSNKGLSSGSSKGLSSGSSKGLSAGSNKGLSSGSSKGLSAGSRSFEPRPLRELKSSGINSDIPEESAGYKRPASAGSTRGSLDHSCMSRPGSAPPYRHAPFSHPVKRAADDWQYQYTNNGFTEFTPVEDQLHCVSMQLRDMSNNTKDAGVSSPQSKQPTVSSAETTLTTNGAGANKNDDGVNSTHTTNENVATTTSPTVPPGNKQSSFRLKRLRERLCPCILHCSCSQKARNRLVAFKSCLRKFAYLIPLTLLILLFLILMPISFVYVDYDKMALLRTRSTGAVDKNVTYYPGCYVLGPDSEFLFFKMIGHWITEKDFSITSAKVKNWVSFMQPMQTATKRSLRTLPGLH